MKKKQKKEKEFKPIRLEFEKITNHDPTFQPIRAVTGVWGIDREKRRCVVARIILTYRNHPTLVPGLPVWQARDEKTSSPLAESLESPEDLQEAVRQHYIKRRTKS